MESTPSRRGFLEAACAATGCAACGLAGLPVATYLIPAADAVLRGPQRIGPSDSLAEGAALMIKLGGLRLLLVRKGGRLSALQAVCTHAGGIIDWKPELQLIKCPLHGAQWGTDGKKISGPAKDQPVYKTREEGGTIFVDLG